MERDELTYSVIGCAMKVHNNLGCGFQEVVYQRSLAIELKKISLNFVREQEQTIYYDSIEVGKRRADFIVENKIVVELKAIGDLEDIHLVQAKNYLYRKKEPMDCMNCMAPIPFIASSTSNCYGINYFN